MEICEFKPEDLDEINEWYKSRGLPKFLRSMAPKTGFIVHGVAAVFVYMTDSSIAIIEGLVSNPEVEKSERRAVIRNLVNYAYDYAIGQKELVVAIIKNGWVKDLAKTTGYRSIGTHELFIKG